MNKQELQDAFIAEVFVWANNLAKARSSFAISIEYENLAATALTFVRRSKILDAESPDELSSDDHDDDPHECYDKNACDYCEGKKD